MTTQRLIPFRSTGLAAVLLFAVSAVAAAQRPTPPTPPPHPAPAPQAAPQATQHPMAPTAPGAQGEPQSFTGVAKRLGTTADALDAAYQAALADNPKLTRGQFIAANILAKNLGTKYPGVTTDAILTGLKSGTSIGKTLEAAGVPADEAQTAEAQANKEAQTGGN